MHSLHSLRERHTQVSISARHAQIGTQGDLTMEAALIQRARALTLSSCDCHAQVSIGARHAKMAHAGESRYANSRIGRRLQAGGLAFFQFLASEMKQQVRGFTTCCL